MLEPTFLDSLTKVVTRENVNHIPANVHLDAVDLHFRFEAYQQWGSSFLAFVLHVRHMQALEWLLATFKDCIDFSIPAPSGATPLGYAIFNWPQAVRLLVEAGAPPKDSFKLIILADKTYGRYQDAPEALFKVGAVDLNRDYGELLPDWLTAMLWRYREYRRRSREAALILLGIQRFRKPLVAERFLAREIARMIWATRCDNKWGRAMHREAAEDLKRQLLESMKK